MTEDITLETLIKLHPEFNRLCMEVVMYAHKANLPVDIVLHGVAWNHSATVRRKLNDVFGV